MCREATGHAFFNGCHTRPHVQRKYAAWCDCERFLVNAKRLREGDTGKGLPRGEAVGRPGASLHRQVVAWGVAVMAFVPPFSNSPLSPLIAHVPFSTSFSFLFFYSIISPFENQKWWFQKPETGHLIQPPSNYFCPVASPRLTNRTGEAKRNCCHLPPLLPTIQLNCWV